MLRKAVQGEVDKTSRSVGAIELLERTEETIGELFAINSVFGTGYAVSSCHSKTE